MPIGIFDSGERVCRRFLGHEILNISKINLGG